MEHTVPPKRLALGNDITLSDTLLYLIKVTKRAKPSLFSQVQQLTVAEAKELRKEIRDLRMSLEWIMEETGVE